MDKDWPSLMPPEYDFVRSLPSEASILPALINRSDASVVGFLENVAQDETWCERHLDLLKTVLTWLTTEFAGRRLSLVLAQRVIATVYAHRRILLPLLPKDLSIQFAGGEGATNTLLFGMASPYLRHVIERQYKRGNILKLIFPDLPDRVYHAIDEYVNKGTTDHLWRDSSRELMQVLLKAAEWRMEGMLKSSATMMKRYINLENAAEMLQTAQMHLLKDLMQCACDVVNSLMMGIELESRRVGDLTLIVHAFKEASKRFLKEIGPSLTGIAFRGETGNDPRAQNLLMRATRLDSLDLATSKNFDVEFLDVVPLGLSTLDLSDCQWLTEAIAQQFLERFQDIVRISFSKDTMLTYAFWARLRRHPAIEVLDLAHCRQISDNEFDVLTLGNTQLLELNIAWCERLSDDQLYRLGVRCQRLQALNLSHCAHLTDRSILEIARSCAHLRRLDISYCPHLTDVGVLGLVNQARELEFLDLRGCSVSSPGIHEIETTRPTLEVRA